MTTTALPISHRNDDVGATTICLANRSPARCDFCVLKTGDHFATQMVGRPYMVYTGNKAFRLLIKNVGDTMENKLPIRKRNRLENYDYSSYGAYFLTVCTADKKNHFWKNAEGDQPLALQIDRPQDIKLSAYGEIVDNAINGIPAVYPALSVEQYVIMPNHIHLLLRVRADEYGRPMVAPTMSRVIKQLKGYVSKRVGCSIWQKSFHDHIIRNREDYDEHAKYIYENPFRWCYDELYTQP